MLKDITLGQYFPGNSVLHRLDPRSKLILLIVYITALFLATGPVSYGLMLVFLLVKSILGILLGRKSFLLVPRCKVLQIQRVLVSRK